jgi:hypothetical protein
MPDLYQSTRHLPFLTDFSARDRQGVEEAADLLDERQRQAEAARRKEADEIREDLDQQLHRLLGGSGSAELREAVERERRAFRDAWQPPAGLGQDYAKATKATNRRIDALVRKLGTTSARLRTLGAEYDTKLLNVLSRADEIATHGYHLESHLDEWLSLSPLHQYPLPWGALPPPDDPSDPHRWFPFRPPFWGFLFSFNLDHQDYQGGGFQVDRELILDPPAGLVGNVITSDCRDADAYAAADARAQIAFGFVPPVAGILQVAVDVQCVQGWYDLTIRDNFGPSDARGSQYNWLMISLLHLDAPETQFALMDESYWETDGDNLTNHQNRLSPVQHYFANLFSSQPLRAGESIVVTVGTRSLDIAALYGMDLHSTSSYQWFISSVEVRIVP